MTIDLFGYVGYDITLQSLKSKIEDSKEEIELNISTYGGSYAEGVAIYDYLLPKKPAINILGVCASAGSTIAMAAGKNKLSMSENAEFMIHPVRTMLMGFYTENELDDEQSNLNIYNKTTKRIYQKRTGLDSDTIDELFNNEKTMDAETAKENGFIDNIISYTDEDDANNRANTFINMMKNINLNYNKVIANTNKKLNKRNIPEQNKKQTTNENNTTNTNGDASMAGKTENADVGFDTSKETINELTTQINELKNELSKKDNAIEMQKKDEIINSMKAEIDEFKRKESEHTNEVIKSNIDKALANIENSKVEITDEFKTTITNCKDLNLSNSLLAITEGYNAKFENVKIPEGDTPTRKTNEKLESGLPSKTKLINAYTDGKEFDALIDKVATDEFDGDDLKAIDAIESNPDLYNVTFTRK